MAHRCLMLLGVFVFGVVFAVASFGCSSTALATVIQRNGGEEPAKPSSRRLVLKLAAKKSPLQGSGTAAFIFELDSQEKVSVENVLEGCKFFNSLDRLLLYAEQERWIDELEFDAVKYLSNGPGCFLNFADDERQVRSKSTHLRPNVCTAEHFSVSFISKMKYGNGAIVWNGPSGVAPDEAWALCVGRFVYNYEDFMREYGASHKSTPRLYRLDGETLQ